MVQHSEQEQKIKEDRELDQRKRAERKLKEQKEEKEYNEYLERLRNLIKEDRKTNLEKAQIEIDGLQALQTVSLKEADIKPLTASRERLDTGKSAEGNIRIKIIHETKKQLHTLSVNATVKDFKEILKTHFNIKKPEAFISTVGKIDFTSLETQLQSLGVGDMDTIYVHAL